MKTDNNNQKGFTIIEVVLVLAIAGLIFLIVFLAVPALQRSQRDTQRRSDVGRFLSQITQYQSNTGGSVPDSQPRLNTFMTNYMRTGGDAFEDPSEGTYTARYVANPTTAPNDRPTINYYLGAKCNADTPEAAGPRDLAVVLQLEGGGQFCQDNS